MISSIVFRIGRYIAAKGLSVRSFEQSIGASNGAIGRAIQKNSDIGTSWLSKIVEIYADLNVDWLITGRGEMLLKATPANSAATHRGQPHLLGSGHMEHIGIPLIPVDAVAGVLSGNSQTMMEYDCERYIIPMFRRAEFLIPVKGDSMHPKYNSGDIVACKRLPMDTFFQWNRTYVVDSEQGILIKRIRPGRDKNHIMLVSENAAYDPFELSLDHIFSIALVIGIVRAE